MKKPRRYRISSLYFTDNVYNVYYKDERYTRWKLSRDDNGDEKLFFFVKDAEKYIKDLEENPQ